MDGSRSLLGCHSRLSGDLDYDCLPIWPAAPERRPWSRGEPRCASRVVAEFLAWIEQPLRVEGTLDRPLCFALLQAQLAVDLGALQPANAMLTRKYRAPYVINDMV